MVGRQDECICRRQAACGCLSVENARAAVPAFLGVTASDKIHVDEMMAETEPDPYVMLQTEWTAGKISCGV